MRLFVALELPTDVRQELDQRTRRARSGLPRARWLGPEAMHLTLVFLGETAEDQLPALHRELRSAFARSQPMDLQVVELGAFPPRGRRRIVWAGVEATGDLGGLQGNVAEAVERTLRIEPERRPYHPHVTLARCKPPWPPSAVDSLTMAYGPEPVEAFRVDHGSLVVSHLHRSGARYKTVETYALKGVG